MSTEVVPALDKILTERQVAEKDAYLAMHNEFSILFRVVSCDRIVDVDRLESRLRDLYVSIVREFSWVRISESVHGFLAHSSEQIRRNQNRGLSSLSEQGSESKNCRRERERERKRKREREKERKKERKKKERKKERKRKRGREGESIQKENSDKS